MKRGRTRKYDAHNACASRSSGRWQVPTGAADASALGGQPSFKPLKHGDAVGQVAQGLANLLTAREMDLVVWERGAGLTEACGTGATAAVAAFVRAGDCPADEDVLVHLPGGDLLVRVSQDLARIRMTGPARRVFEGRVF